MKFSDLNLLSIGHTIQLAGAILQGEGKTLLLFFPEDKNDSPIETLELSLDEWQAVIRQSDTLETEIYSKASDGTLAKIIYRKSQRQIDAGVSWRVFQRDEFHCRYCWATGVPLTVDHLVLWEEGGPSTEANLVSSCKKCNKVRGNKPYSEWLKHPRYLETSQKVPMQWRDANAALVSTLDKIPKVIHQRSR
jgi:hypothetical protein